MRMVFHNVAETSDQSTLSAHRLDIPSEPMQEPV